MAKLEQGILGPFRGKVGTVVGYLWRGKHVVRAYRREINYPNTESQQAEREWFVGMVRFAATARQALLLGLREMAAREQMTEGNVFVRMNKGCFGRGAARRVRTGVDYEHIRIAEGAAAPVRFSMASVDENNVLHVDFERNSGMTRAKGSDRVYVYVYNTDTREGLLSHPAERRRGHLVMLLPEGWNERNVRMWGFVVDGEERASGSAYIALGGVSVRLKESTETELLAHDAGRCTDDEPMGLHLGQDAAERGSRHTEHLGSGGDAGD